MSHPVHAGLQVAVEEGVQVAYHEAPEVNGLGTYKKEGSAAKPKRISTTQTWGRFGIVVLALVTVGTVVGGIGISKTRGTHRASSTSADGNAYYRRAKTLGHIAAVSWETLALNSTRVYFQDRDGQILEAGKEFDDPAWNINKTGIVAKNGSAVATALLQPGWASRISLFFFDINNRIHDTIYNQSTQTWSPGTLSKSGYQAMPNSSLAAIHTSCNLCANTTIIAFQDYNGHIQIGNLTRQGWEFTNLSQALNPVVGTGLVLQAFNLHGLESQLSLFHQKSDLRLSLATYIPASKTNPSATWSLSDQSYRAIPFGSFIAAASSNFGVSARYEEWIELLSTYTEGIQFNDRPRVINDSFTRPSVMKNPPGRTYGSVAVSTMGGAFAVVKQDGQPDEIATWQVKDDLVTWISTGNIDLNEYRAVN